MHVRHRSKQILQRLQIHSKESYSTNCYAKYCVISMQQPTRSHCSSSYFSINILHRGKSYEFEIFILCIINFTHLQAKPINSLVSIVAILLRNDGVISLMSICRQLQTTITLRTDLWRPYYLISEYMILQSYSNWDRCILYAQTCHPCVAELEWDLSMRFFFQNFSLKRP